MQEMSKTGEDSIFVPRNEVNKMLKYYFQSVNTLKTNYLFLS